MTTREKIGFAFGWVAILLRLANDWLFASGSPLPYLLAQAAFLGVGIAYLWPNLAAIFLGSGRHRQSLREGLVALPVGLLLAAVSAYTRYGALEWATVDQTLGALVGNVLFTAIEELEFRGFLLALLLRLGGRPSTAVWLQALVPTLGHTH